jgi:GH43 family beta-xylosidase
VARPFIASFGVGLVFALAVAACGADDEEPHATTTFSTGEGDTTSPTDDAATMSPSTADDTGESSTSVPDDTTGDIPPPIVPGVSAEYFAGYHDLVLSRVENSIDAVWGMAAPDEALGADRFSARWSGWLTAPSTGTYTLVTETDDGVRLWIDDVLVIADWTPHFVTRNEAQVELTAGVAVPIRLEYFEIDLDASARLLWSSAAIAEAPIDSEHLTTVEVPSEQPSPKPPYHNPAVPFDCPDPGVIAVTDDEDTPSYAMVCTGGTFPIRTSRDLVFWSDTGAMILPNGKTSWGANGNRNWAPEIHRIGDRYVAYFTCADGANRLSIGYATADDVLGPYTESAGPLVQDPVGVIDATYFTADGVHYLFYKIDGNSVGQPTPIFVRELAADGESFAPGSAQIQVLVNDGGTWEGGVVEAPWVVANDGMYFLFYSGNVYDHRYRTGVARSASPTGPYEKLGGPILTNNERWVGPGHGTVLDVGGLHYFTYHAWPNAGDGTQDGGAGRHGLVDRIDWVDGWPTIHDGTPSRTWQPWPGEIE